MIKQQIEEYIVVCAFMALGKTTCSRDRSDVWDYDFGLYRQLMSFKPGSVPTWVKRSYAIALVAGGDRFRYVCVNEPYICQSYLHRCVFVLPTFDEATFEERLRQRSPDGSVDMYLVSLFDRYVADWAKIATACNFPIIKTDGLSKALCWLDHNPMPKGSSIITTL